MKLDLGEIRNHLHDGEIVFEYHGEIQEELISFIFEKVTKRLSETEHVVNKVKRVGKLSLELIQNSLAYIRQEGIPKERNEALLMIHKSKSQYTIVSGNILDKSAVLPLHEKLSRVNQMRQPKASEVYRTEMLSGELREDGAGLGLLEIIRKAGNKFKYEFIDLSPEYSFCVIKVMVAEQSGLDSLEVVGTSETPSIQLDKKEGKLSFKGRSIPQNAVAFYRPVLEWTEDYIVKPHKSTTIEIELDYINTSSSKCLLEFFKLFEAEGTAKKVQVNWYYEEGDDDMHEAGEDYNLIVNIPFNFIVIPENQKVE